MIGRMAHLARLLRSKRGARVIGLAAIVLVTGLAATGVSTAYRQARRHLDTRFIEATRNATRAVITSHADFSRFVVERNVMRPEVTGVIHEALRTGDYESARRELLARSGDLYDAVYEHRFRQLHFHLPDGRSLLRFHAREKWGDPLFGIRESVRIANVERRPVEGFEEGRIYNGYRFVYPLSFEDRHVGSVELSISFETVASALRSEFDRPGEFIVRRSVIDATLFEDERHRYVESPLAPEYLADAATVPDEPPSWYERVRDAVGAEVSNERLARGMSFAQPVRVGGEHYVAVYMDVRNLLDEHVGFFVTYEPSAEYRTIVREAVERTVLLAAVLGAAVAIAALFDRSRRLADEANRAKSTFLANVSHEIRTPMGAVTGLIDDLADPALDEPTRAEHVRLLRSASEDLVEMVNSILEMSRIETGRVDLEDERFSVRDVVGDLVDSMRAADVAHGLDLRLVVGDGVPDAVRGDASRFRQVVRNCLHNALKFTTEGGVTVDVNADPAPDDRAHLTITVTDTGVGIPESALPTIFDKFSRAQTPGPEGHTGSGLGLSIVKSIVELMGGTISLRSLEGVGTTVTVELDLPIAPVEEADPEPADSTDEEPAQAPVRTGTRVLLAEDDRIGRLVGVAMLEKHGMEVTVAKDGVEAYELGKAGGFDVILMDRLMPRMDGLEATRRLITWWDEHGVDRIPIIGLSGLTSAEDRAAALEAGMTGFAAKPIRPDEILAQLNRATSESPIDLSQTEGDIADPDELVGEILPIFLEQSRERLCAIDAALESRDAAAIHAQTHPLKTAARYLGAGALGRVAKDVDDRCRADTEPDWDEVASLVARIHREIDEIERWRDERVARATREG
ncbi:MAG: ATP-binding protein [Spirochaetota bacterium]